MVPAAILRPHPAQVVRLIQGLDRRVLKGAGLVGALMVLYLGVKVSPAIVFVLGTCIGMLLFAIYLATWVLRKDEGTPDMQEVSGDAAARTFQVTPPASAGLEGQGSWAASDAEVLSWGGQARLQCGCSILGASLASTNTSPFLSFKITPLACPFYSSLLLPKPAPPPGSLTIIILGSFGLCCPGQLPWPATLAWPPLQPHTHLCRAASECPPPSVCALALAYCRAATHTCLTQLPYCPPPPTPPPSTTTTHTHTHHHHHSQISNAIRDGAEGYFATQYGTIGRLALVLCGVVFLVYMFRRETPEQLEAGLNRCGDEIKVRSPFFLGGWWCSWSTCSAGRPLNNCGQAWTGGWGEERGAPFF